METQFMASNGMILVPHRDGSVRWESGFTPKVVSTALREFFLHERDQELGRWRWPENPDYVVYLVGDDTVDVLRESSVSDKSRGPGWQAGITREQATKWDKNYYQNFFAAARAYFAAQPEPKSWFNDARTGDVWILTVDGQEQTAMLDSEGDYLLENGEWIYTNHEPSGARVTSGRRIYRKGATA